MTAAQSIAIDPEFEIPSQYRWNLGVKHTLPLISR